MGMQEESSPSFCFPVTRLHSSRIVLVPFIPSQHAKLFFDASSPHTSLYRYLPFGPFSALPDFNVWYNGRIHFSPADVLFAIFDGNNPHDPNKFAGIIGLINSSTKDSSTEIGCIIILPQFQHTHVSRDAIGLLLHYCLDLPSQGGLGLRRVQWKANAANTPSVRVAVKMGFIKEGVIRWHWALPSHKEGEPTHEDDPCQNPGRHTVLLALCWDDWKDARAKVDALMDQ